MYININPFVKCGIGGVLNEKWLDIAVEATTDLHTNKPSY